MMGKLEMFYIIREQIFSLIYEGENKIRDWKMERIRDSSMIACNFLLLFMIYLNRESKDYLRHAFISIEIISVFSFQYSAGDFCFVVSIDTTVCSIDTTVRILDSAALRDLGGTTGEGVNARFSRYCEFVTACGAIRPGVIPIIPAIILSPS